METRKRITLTMLIIFGSISLWAQQDAMFTHYMYNTIAVNPAYAGSRDALTITALHRSQWVNFGGAPTTQTLTVHTPMLNNKLGLGLSIVNDKIGPINNTSANIDFAYVLKVSENSKLAFGLKGGINYMKANLSTLNLDQQNDIEFQESSNTKLMTNFGFGMYYYRPRFYAGISTPKLLENNFKTNTATGVTNIATEKRHYFFIAGSVFKLTNTIELKPTTFVKVTMAAPIEADVTASFIFNKRLLLGGMFRTGDAVGLLVGYNITDQFHAGYSFDWSYGMKTFKYNQGSHEIMLSYDFIYGDKQKIRSPRYF